MSVDFFSALLLSLFVFGLTALVLCGWGSIVTRLLKVSSPTAALAFTQIWLGWAVVLLLLNLINFFAPLNWIVTGGLAVGGLLAWWFNGRTVLHFSRNRRVLFYGIVLLLTAGWVAAQSMLTPVIYDSGLYHLQSLRWYNEYPVVPGLGNLHGRLAFNQSFFAFAAALNVYPFFHHGYALANAFLIVLLAAEGWYAFFFKRWTRSISAFVAVFILPLLAYLVFRQSVSSPSPDMASGMLQFLIWLHFARLLEERPAAQAVTARTHILFILAATAVTIKLSNLVFVGVIGFILLLRDWLAQRNSLVTPVENVLSLARLIWFPLLIMLVWVGRSYLLSGYPVYPATIGGIDADWAMPVAAVKAEAKAIYLWARYEAMPLANNEWDWLWPWLISSASGTKRVALAYPVACSVLMAAVYFLARVVLRVERVQPEQTGLTPREVGQTPYALLALPIFIGLLVWFFSAPDPRFVRSLLWLLPILMAHILLKTFEQAHWGRPHLNLAILFLVVNLAVVVTFATYWRQALQMQPGFAPLSVTKLETQTTDFGLTLQVAVEDARCWDAPLPCIPSSHFNPKLRARGADIQQGFALVQE